MKAGTLHLRRACRASTSTGSTPTTSAVRAERDHASMNPDAREQAAALDRSTRCQGRPGRCTASRSIVKDNFETTGLQTAAGSLALKDFDPGARRLPGETHQGGRRHRAREVEHGGVGVQPVRDRQFAPARLYEKSLRARSRHGRIERRHGRGGRGEFRRRSVSAAIPATRSAAPRHTRRSSASARRWG